MAIIDLNRRFHEWKGIERPDPEMRLAFGLDDGGIGWEELLEKRRVVILAEAGSGKSTEFAERSRATALSQEFVFHASVEDVGRSGVENALPIQTRGKLAAWKRSTEEAWFFIDSIDEAKLANVKFDRVARNLADGVHGAEERCHIFLSGRVTDWEPRRDVEILAKRLSAASEISKPEPTPEQELLRIIRSQHKRKTDVPSMGAPLVVIMAQLDRERVHRFAEAAGIPQVEHFLKAVDDADLWHFARRPLDLDWLVRFWRSERRLGTLREMVDRSITEWLKETNPDRTRATDLSLLDAVRAAERIGAAMVFGRETTIAIPDRDPAFASDSSLDLAEILPDWSGDARGRLLTRPIFDPATLGRVRFHNDNDGTARSFLAARWLVRLREANLSTANLFRLLFANSYGLEVIKPSMNETAAWLCLWDRDVSNEVIKRGPGLLLIAGDPASLSVGVRNAALIALLRESTAEDQEWPWWDNDKLRRFAQSDLGDTVLSLWPQYRTHAEASQLLMRLIWLGGLKECCPLAREVAFDSSTDSLLRIFAGRALLAMTDSGTLADYAALITTDPVKSPVEMVRDVLEELFPEVISVSDLLRILAELNVEDDVLGFGGFGAALARKLESADHLESLLVGLLSQMTSQLGDHSHAPTKREEALFPAMAESALRLLKKADVNNAPSAAIDTVLRIGNRHEHHLNVRSATNEVLTELHRTPERRRQAFWRVVATFRATSPSQLLDRPFQIEFFGYPPGLQAEDVEWLLTDGTRGEDLDSRLAVNTAMAIYHSHGAPASLLAKIEEAVSSDPVGQATFAEWTTPHIRSEAELKSERELREAENQNKAEWQKRDQSWIDFLRDIQLDPARIANLRLPLLPAALSDLTYLWRLLNGATDHQRYALDSVAPLERIAGAQVAKAVEQGLIAHWRTCEPLVRSRRKPQEHNVTRWLDLMGLTGITLEAKRDPSWAIKLSDDEASRAAEFATLEMNGFPYWIIDLVASHPTEVRAVLHREIKAEVTRDGVGFFETLQAVTHSKEGVAALLAPVLLEDLEVGLSMPHAAVLQVLRILVNSLAESERKRFEKWAVARFEQERDISIAVQYLAAVFSISPMSATAILIQKANSLDEVAQTLLVDRFLTARFGSVSSGEGFKTVTEPPAEIIEELVRLNFRTQKQVASRRRPDGVIYHADDNDRLDDARSVVFHQFVKTPGAATFHALRRLQLDSSCPVAPARLRALAEQRAVEDSENAPWAPGEVYTFEQSAETSPRTGKDLCTVLIGRIEDMRHELLHDDFSQGQTLKRLTPEREVQKWVADRLRLRAGRSYSIEREPHVADEKEPDVRITAKATEANCSMEVKVAESWTLDELDEALEAQLCGRYLRSDRGRYGVLLLVHQIARPLGWENKATGTYLTFVEVVARLRARALAISGESNSGPQPEVAALDISAC